MNGYTGDMTEITRDLSLDEKGIHYDFVRASGPSGQNANKIIPGAQLF